ncbi:MAG: hypothetical protein ACLQVL_26735 [Terriglobia bacterium]
MAPSGNSGPWRREGRSRGGKKPADAIHHEIAPEVDRLLQVIFRDQRRTGRRDGEAVEVAVRAACHRTGAVALTEFLRFPAPAADIARREPGEIPRALPLDLPVAAGEPIPILYVQMDGTGVPVVKKETRGRLGKVAGQPAQTREVTLACVFLPNRVGCGGLPHPRSRFHYLSARWKPPRSSAHSFSGKPGNGAGAVPKSRW